MRIHSFRHRSGRGRRQLLEEELAKLPAGPPRGAFPRAVSAGDEPCRAARQWGETLTRLGPIFAAAGRHLASRRDLFPSQLCRRLSSLQSGSAAPLPAVLECLRQELGSDPERSFARIEPAPPGPLSGLFQRHRARLVDGTAVCIRLVPPDLVPYLEDDLERLSLLAPALESWTSCPDGRQRVDEALDLTRSRLENELDLLHEAEALGSLSDGPPGDLRVPRVYRRLSTDRVLTTEDLDAVCLELRALDPAENERLALRLCRTWLRQALLGCRLPLDPGPSNVGFTADRRIVFLGGGFVRLRPSWQDRLRAYLEAAADHDPDRTCSTLAEICDVSPASERHGARSLRNRFRQLQPRRDGTSSARGDQLADYLLLHRRSMTELGCPCRPPMADFYRGLGALRDSVRRLDPEDDPFRAAFEELSLDAELGRWRQRLDLGQLSRDLGSCVDLFVRLPQTLETALSAVEGGLHIKVELPQPSAGRRPRKATSIATLLLALTALPILVERLAALPEPGEWTEKLGAILFLVLGGALLRALGRS